MNRYHNLTEMLAINRSAHAYFSQLPAHVRRMIIERGDCVRSQAELQGYAEQLMHQND